MSDPKHAVTLAAPVAVEVSARVHPVVQAAMAAGPDPATLRELLAIQREWEAGEARRAYTRAIVALKRDLPAALARDATVDFTTRAGIRTHYTHTSLAAAVEAVTPHLTAHGFALTWEPRVTEKAVEVTCHLTHCEGHGESATLAAPADQSGNKSPAQAVASTVTLLSRYTALALLGIATRDMAEPTGEPEPDAIDTARNLRAVAEVTRRGHTVDAARALCGGREVADWTAADLDALREWLRPTRREPGEDG